MSRTYLDEAITDGQALLDETRAHGRKVRAWYRSGRVTITCEGVVDGHPYSEAGPYPITWFGRGASILDALAWLGAYEAW